MPSNKYGPHNFRKKVWYEKIWNTPKYYKKQLLVEVKLTDAQINQC